MRNNAESFRGRMRVYPPLRPAPADARRPREASPRPEMTRRGVSSPPGGTLRQRYKTVFLRPSGGPLPCSQLLD